MFKKRERKGRNHSTRKKRDEDDGSNDDSDTIDNNDPSGAAQSDDALQSIIAKTKQRRTLIDQLQSKRGVDAIELLQQSRRSSSSIDNSNLNENIDDTINRTNMSSRVDALSSKTQLPTGGTIVAEEQMIWDQKHAAAMEEYVQQQLLLKSSLSSNHKVTTIHETEEEPQSTTDATTASSTIKSLATSKEQLYRDLAAQAAKLSGTEPNTGVHPLSTHGLHHDEMTTTSGDVVTAGAATAIMEVILPLDDRLQAVMATARCAAHQHPPTNHPRTTMTTGRPSSSAVPNRFRSSYNHHHPMGHTTNHGVRKRPLSDDHHGVDATTESSSLTSERPGFAAARLLQQQQQQQNRSVPNRTGKNPNQNSQYSRSTDDRVYQQFIKRQREQHGR